LILRRFGRAPAQAIGFLLLILVTLGLLAFERDLLERTETLYPASAATTVARPHSDAAAGGASVMARRGPGLWSCTLREVHRFPFCGLEVVLAAEGGRGADLSRASRILLDYSYTGPAESLRLNLRNFDPSYSRADVPSSTKYNTLELRVGQGRATADLSMGDFSVAGWWLTEHKIPSEHAGPEFGNVISVQLLTGNEAPAGSHSFALHRIVVHARLMTSAEFYVLLVALWGVAIGGCLLLRIAAAGRALRLEIQARERAEDYARALARHDSPTGVLNRHAFRDELGGRLAAAAAAGETGAVFLIEIGSLRSVNEVCGHAAGDELLVESVRRLEALCGSDAVAGRMGGNELALFIPGEASAGEERATAIAAGLNQAFGCCGSSLNPAATIGVACFPAHGSDYAALLRATDIALHEAKRAGGGIHRFYNSDLEGGASERIARIKGRERVLKASEERPAFVARARTDLMVREGCRLASAWSAETGLSLSLTAAEWQEDWTAERIVTQIDMSGLARSRVTVALSETLFLARAGATLRNLHALQAAGVRLALTGFRSGFDPAASSIRFDEIEIDPAFLGTSVSGAEKKLFVRRA